MGEGLLAAEKKFDIIFLDIQMEGMGGNEAARSLRQLGDGFYRCHRGYLVNMAHIARYDSDSIFLSGGEKVYLTRKKHNEFVKAYMWCLQNGGVSCV